MFKRILVPLDGSRRAESALPVAVRIVRVSSGRIYLTRVAPTPESYFWGAPEAVAMLPGVIDEEQKNAREYLQEVSASPELLNVSVCCRLAEGEPAQAILDMVQDQQTDLVIMCSHGATGFKRWVLGSVSHKVARYCSAPILILHERDTQPFTPWSKESGRARVLVPLDGSSLAEAALQPARDLAQALSAPGQAALHLLCVLPARDTDHRPFAERDAHRQRAEAYLRSIEERMKGEQTSEQSITLTSSILLADDAASAVVDFSQRGTPCKGESGCDVIAMATHGRSGFSRWIMGSVTERVLNTCRVPILVVRPDKISPTQR